MIDSTEHSSVFAIDMDTHVVEPWDLWERYMDGPMRPGAPRAVQDNWGMRRLMVESRLFPTPEGPGRAPRRQFAPEQQARYSERVGVSQSPQSRLEEMGRSQVERAVLLPSQGLVVGAIRDPELAAAVAVAYNRWLAEFCSADPARLMGAVVVPLQDIRTTLRLVTEHVETSGFCGVCVRPNPVLGRTLLDPYYHPLFALCQDLGVPLFVHEGCGFAPGETVGIDRFENGLFSHMISHPMEQMLAMLALVAGGVLERFPRLKVAFLEAGSGWAPFWLERMDEHVEMLSWEAPWLTMPPSDYFRRQCVISCDAGEKGVREVLDRVGAANVVFASDYPHADEAVPDDLWDSTCFEGLTAEQRRAVGRDNAAKFLARS